jgi:hypothetical protein
MSISGCTRHLQDNVIVGEYNVAGHWGKSTLQIRSDGTFSQDLLLQDGKTEHLNGKWQMIDSNTKSFTRTIWFRPFLNMQEAKLGNEILNAGCTIEAIGWRSVWIDVDSDAGITYKKW